MDIPKKNTYTILRKGYRIYRPARAMAPPIAVWNAVEYRFFFSVLCVRSVIRVPIVLFQERG